MKADPVRILGIDTSLRSTGIGVLTSDGFRHQVVTYGTITAPRTWPLSRCLNNLREKLEEIISAEKPVVAAVEGIFFCKNVKTAVILGQARGVVIATCTAAGLPVYEYAPRSVKQGVVGRGAADKSQVAQMVKVLLGLPEVPQNDAADALAIAHCHANQMRSPAGARKTL
ncbi:MAG: crossover junction endodeoxyribonuclease RuvC [Verrucomicrobia bacterium]|nr:crossover junction endodeoxyribonuclease RuvC [Verrucomicrobiota bacterium]MCH8512362.1 crossover junction endodeoxyribonuclease RuvC [Kiritimatiellia bacterium]